MKILKLLAFSAVLLASAWGICLLDAAENPSAIHIQRTMKALEESTAENPAHIRVMFYGQSIVAQAWTAEIQKFLTEKYPTVQFEFFNGAIGGFESPNLVRTAESDLYPWYPDLLFFHVYGPIDKYEEIVRKTRERTTAEIILWTSHLSEKQDPKAMLLERDQRSKDIFDVAERYHCMIIDLNKKWCQMLIDNGWEPNHVLADGIHLNEEGIKYYANFIWEDICRIPGTDGEPDVSGSITEFPADAPCVTVKDNGDQVLHFNGNRVTAVFDGSAEPGKDIALLLDGKPLAEFPELWRMTRTSQGPCWMPAIRYVGSQTLPVKEEWTLTAIDGSAEDGSLIAYRVEGSVTGEDGEGRSDKPFVSRSGRITLEPSDLGMTWQFPYFKQKLPQGFQVKWSAEPLFADSFKTGDSGSRVLVLEGCSNEAHDLTLSSSNGKLGVGKWIVNQPAK